MIQSPLLVLALLFLTTSYCSDSETKPAKTTNYEYNSDYFVFISDDTANPLVIPIDVDWYPTEDGYGSTFKSWYGTQKKWPIGYASNNVKKPDSFPKEVWDFADHEFIRFDKENRELITKISGAPKIRLKIPNKTTWSLMPTTSNLKKMYAFRTSAMVGDMEKTGWVIYERIRWDAELAKNFESFKAFFWLPIILDGKFYHFEQHKGEQTAVRWSLNDSKIEVDTIPSFTFNQTSVTKDSKSKRDNIPQEIQLIAPEWNVDLTLQSTGEQIGYGEKFPKGLAYYRQSLLEPVSKNTTKGYGMMELILENN